MTRIAILILALALTGCASLQSGIHNTAASIAKMAPDIADGAKTVTADVGAAGVAVVDVAIGVGNGAQAVSTATAPATAKPAGT